jgi:hypothetical protein
MWRDGGRRGGRGRERAIEHNDNNKIILRITKITISENMEKLGKRGTERERETTLQLRRHTSRHGFKHA